MPAKKTPCGQVRLDGDGGRYVHRVGRGSRPDRDIVVDRRRRLSDESIGSRSRSSRRSRADGPQRPRAVVRLDIVTDRSLRVIATQAVLESIGVAAPRAGSVSIGGQHRLPDPSMLQTAPLVPIRPLNS